MTKEDCFILGYISKRVGNNGDLILVLDVDAPEKYKKLKTLFIEINETLVPFFINKIIIRTNDAQVSLEGIDSIDKTNELIKCGVYLPLNLLPKLNGKKFYFHEIPGFTVIDTVYGNIGKVEKILEFPQQVILQIVKDSIEILIPVREEFIVSIDRASKILSINAPEGLIDVYLNPDNQKNTDK